MAFVQTSYEYDEKKCVLFFYNSDYFISFCKSIYNDRYIEIFEIDCNKIKLLCSNTNEEYIKNIIDGDYILDVEIINKRKYNN